MSSPRPERLTENDFPRGRLARPGTWAVAFLADWCPFCRAFEPGFLGISTEGRFTLAVADLTSEASPLWDDFRIEIVPSVVVFRDGDPIHRADGRPGYGLDSKDLAAVRAAALGSTR